MKEMLIATTATTKATKMGASPGCRPGFTNGGFRAQPESPATADKGAKLPVCYRWSNVCFGSKADISRMSVMGGKRTLARALKLCQIIGFGQQFSKNGQALVSHWKINCRCPPSNVVQLRIGNGH